jgi:hypothetical protein
MRFVAGATTSSMSLEAGLKSKDDAVVLATAVTQRRALLTHNVADFLPLAGAYARQGKEHFGILVAKQMDVKALLERTTRALADRTPADLLNAVVWLT